MFLWGNSFTTAFPNQEGSFLEGNLEGPPGGTLNSFSLKVLRILNLEEPVFVSRFFFFFKFD